MRPTAFVLAGLFAIAVAGTAHAGDCGGDYDVRTAARDMFEAADRNGNGTLSPAEYESAGLERFDSSFADTDTNSDGATSLSEYLELYERNTG